VAKNPHSGLRLMEASRYIKIIFFALFSAGLLFWAYRQLPTRQLTVLAILLVGTFFTLCDIYKTFYDATLASKINLVVNNTALIIYVGVNLVFVHLGLDLIWFAATLAMRSFIAYSVRSVIFHLKRREKKRTIHGVIKFKNIKTYNTYLLKIGLPLATSSLAIVIYTRIDQIMLGQFIGSHAVGIYSATLAISGGWVLVPMAVITSFMSTIASERDAGKAADRAGQLYMLTLASCLPVLLLIGSFSSEIIRFLYGAAYQEAATILFICTLTSLCSVLGTIAYRIILMHAGYVFMALKMPIVALINIFLNYHFIPLFGIKGAALSTLFSEAISLLVLNAFFKQGVVTHQMFSAYKSVPKFITEVQLYVKSINQASH